jgi:ABC-type multidrug transport system fused ATPase/permease subunit
VEISPELFKALSKMIEDRFRFGRQIVNVILALAILAVAVFLIQYLFKALTTPVAGLVAFITTGNVPSMPLSPFNSLLNSLVGFLITVSLMQLIGVFRKSLDTTTRHLQITSKLSDQVNLLIDEVAKIKKRLDGRIG